MSRLGRIARTATSLVISFVTGMAIALLVAATAPTLVGWKSLTVLTGSMQPELGVGDVVVDQRIHPAQIRVGDMITFREPGSTRLITHRVRGLSVTRDTYHVVTKGDANHTTEKWNIEANGTVGRVKYHVPKIGYVMVWARSPLGRIILVVIPALLLALYELVRIWRPSEKKPPADPHVSHGAPA